MLPAGAADAWADGEGVVAAWDEEGAGVGLAAFFVVPWPWLQAAATQTATASRRRRRGSVPRISVSLHQRRWDAQPG
jgi:hypothetical protein